MKTIERYIKSIAYSFRIACDRCRAKVYKYLFFSLFSSVAGCLFDVYFLSSILKLLIENAEWQRIKNACIFGAFIVLIKLITKQYADSLYCAISAIDAESIRGNIYQSSLNYDLSAYYNSEFYNNYSFVLTQGIGKINKCINLIRNIMEGFLYLILFVFECCRQDGWVSMFLVGMLILHIISMCLRGKYVDVFFDEDKRIQLTNRRKEYYKRIFRVKAFAYEVKNEKLFEYTMNQYAESMKQYERESIALKKKVCLWDVMGYIYDNLVNLFIAPLVIVLVMSIQGIRDISTYWQVNAIFTKMLGIYFLRMHADIKDIYNYTEKIKEFLEYSPNNEMVSRSPETMEIRAVDLCFAYDKYNSFQLKQINFQINKGEKIAIVGRNGSGKSTLFKLLLGLFKCDCGKLLLGGINIEELNDEKRSGLYALLCQDFNLFYGTIRDNITMGDNSFTDEEIYAATVGAHCDELIKSLPKGLDTLVGREIDENAVEFSGGQAQRIALARVFLSKAPIILLDEPIAAIDGADVRDIIEDLLKQKQGKTVIMISHNLNVISEMDRIFVMERGELVETGTFEGLLASKSVFSDMYKYLMEEQTCGLRRKISE